MGSGVKLPMNGGGMDFSEIKLNGAGVFWDLWTLEMTH